MPERDEVLGIERKGRFEDGSGFLDLSRLVQRLTIHDVPAHMAGLLRQVFPTDRDRLLDVARFAVFVRQRGEIPPRILLEFLAQFVYAGRARHDPLPVRTRASRVGGGMSGKIHIIDGGSQSEVTRRLDFSFGHRVASKARRWPICTTLPRSSALC